MRYFKIKTGYAANDFVQVDETELENIYYIFYTNSKGILKNGQVLRGQDIINITEDWHREFGWNAGYPLGPDDWSQIATRRPKYVGVLAESKEKVQHLMRINRPDLIGKNVEIKEINSRPEMFSELSDAVAALAESKKI